MEDGRREPAQGSVGDIRVLFDSAAGVDPDTSPAAAFYAAIRAVVRRGSGQACSFCIRELLAEHLRKGVRLEAETTPLPPRSVEIQFRVRKE